MAKSSFLLALFEASRDESIDPFSCNVYRKTIIIAPCYGLDLELDCAIRRWFQRIMNRTNDTFHNGGYEGETDNRTRDSWEES